jgi:hypothetical protein
MKLATLSDVRTPIGDVPVERREMTTWRYGASQLAEAAGSAIDAAHVAVTLRLVLMMEGVDHVLHDTIPCRAIRRGNKWPAVL